MRTVHLTSLGCPKNLVDSELMLGALEKDGWHLVTDPEEASLLLINTCGFIQPAIEEAIDEILGLVAVKERHPDKLVVVAGCLVQRYQDKLAHEFPEIDMFVGTERAADIARLVSSLEAGGMDQCLHLGHPFLMNSSHPRRLVTPTYRAWMKITEGCNNHCAYCIIPAIRGRLRSREIPDLVEEGVRLEQEGVRELTLIAQDLTAFGNDRKQQDQVPVLLEELLRRTHIPWLRLMYLYPTGVTDRLLDVMASHSRVVPYLDIPFQHASDAILKRMNRRYGRDDLFRLLERIRNALPDVALRTTMLVGFPGETDKDMLLLEDFLKSAKIEPVGVFAYVTEEGSSSEHFPNQCSEKEKQTRVDHIMSLQADISQGILKKYIGRTELVLVEGFSRETDLLLEGRTRFQAPEIDGCVLINEGQATAGDIVSVRIDDALVYDLVGGIVC